MGLLGALVKGLSKSSTARSKGASNARSGKSGLLTKVFAKSGRDAKSKGKKP